MYEHTDIHVYTSVRYTHRSPYQWCCLSTSKMGAVLTESLTDDSGENGQWQVGGEEDKRGNPRERRTPGIHSSPQSHLTCLLKSCLKERCQVPELSWKSSLPAAQTWTLCQPGFFWHFFFFQDPVILSQIQPWQRQQLLTEKGHSPHWSTHWWIQSLKSFPMWGNTKSFMLVLSLLWGHALITVSLASTLSFPQSLIYFC